MDTNPEVQPLVSLVRRGDEYRWFFQRSYGLLTPETLIDALMVDGQVWQVKNVRHHFDQDRDDHYPVCPLRAYQDVEIRDVWNLPPERPGH